MITTLTGENSFTMRRRLNELVNQFLTKYGELSVERFDAEETEAQTIIEAIQSMPFLATRKITVVRNGSVNQEFSQRIEQIINSIPETTDLILYEPRIDKRTAYFKVLAKQTKMEEFANPDKNRLAKLLAEEAKKQAAHLSYANANYLVERIGENQEMLFNELTKLAIYDPDISKENIDLLTEPTPQSKVFELLDAAFTGRKAKALELYEDQRAQKVEPEMILAMIAWQLRLLTLAKLANGRSPDNIAKDSGLNPYPVKKAVALAGKLGQNKLRQMVSQAAEIDLKSKTTTYDLDEALKTFITTI